jgi:hypothetical protein
MAKIKVAFMRDMIQQVTEGKIPRELCLVTARFVI